MQRYQVTSALSLLRGPRREHAGHWPRAAPANAHGGFVGAGAVPDHNGRAIGIGILFSTVQAFEAIGLRIERAEQTIERAVLQHQHDDVVDLLQ